jgi:hypothetical protein
MFTFTYSRPILVTMLKEMFCHICQTQACNAVNERWRR